MKIIAMVAHDFGQGHQALRKNVRVGHWDVADAARGKRGPLRRVLSIDLIRRRRDLHLFVKLLSVVQGQGEFVGSGAHSERLPGEQEKTCLANFYLVVSGGKTSKHETPRAIGFGAEHLAAAVFKLYLRRPDGNAVFVEHDARDRKSTRLRSSHSSISYA